MLHWLQTLRRPPGMSQTLWWSYKGGVGLYRCGAQAGAPCFSSGLVHVEWPHNKAMAQLLKGSMHSHQARILLE